MSHRRTVNRRPVRGPVGAELNLCGGRWARGHVSDESFGGFGFSFTGRDARLVRDHADCCVGTVVRLRFVDDPRRRALGVRLAHVTPSASRPGTLRAGVSVNAAQLRASEVQYIFDVWERLCA